MNRTPVDSSNLQSVGYDPQTSTLEVEFAGGGIYQFFDVPEAVHAELMKSDSKGKFFGAQVKGNFRYAKL
jgi:hypothetical protein